MKIYRKLLIGAALLPVFASAANANVPVVAGGVSKEGRAAIEHAQEKGNYNLKVVFSGKEGIYLAQVRVIIRDDKGRAVVNGVTRGPILLAELSPGYYTVEAQAGGYKSLQHVQVGSGIKTLSVAMPVSDNIGPAAFRDVPRQEFYRTTFAFY